MIELPSGPAVIEERLAALADPLLAERLVRENPELFTPEPPRTQREVLRWATRRVGTAVIAVTAAVSIVAGYFGSELGRHPAPVAPHAVPAAAAVAVPHAHPRAAAHHAAKRAAVQVVRHAAPAIVHHVAPAAAVYLPPRVVHVAPVVHPRQDREALLLRARLHARDLEVARLRAEAAAARAAARTAQARAAAQAQHAAVAPAAAPQTRPQSEPAPATGTATAAGPSREPASGTGTGSAPAPAPDGTRHPTQTSPGGIWNERIPGGGTLGGAIGPILVGVPRDSCTPQGGRTGAVTRIIEAAQIIQSLSRH